MGKTISKKEQYLTSDEIKASIDQETLLRLDNLFSNYKNDSGLVSAKDLLFVLDKVPSLQIVSRLMEVVPLNANKFTFTDLTYLFCILKSEKLEVKATFIVDLIFGNETFIRNNELIQNLNNFLDDKTNSQNLLLIKQIEEKYSNKLVKTKAENFKQFLLNNKALVNKFTFFDKIEATEKIKESNQFKIKHFCCSCAKSAVIERRHQTMTFTRTNEPLFEPIKIAFSHFEKENNGFFSLSIYEKMLYELGVHSKIISSIISFIKHKTKKTFLNFEQFKWLLEQSDKPNSNDFLVFIYQIFKLEHEYLNKKDLIKFINSFLDKEDKEIEKLINEKYSNTDEIKQNDFDQIITDYGITIIENFEKLKYIPFIFFKYPCEDKIKQRNCIKLLFRNHDKSLKDFIKSQIYSNKNFYIVSSEFWNNWCEYVNWPEIKTLSIDSKALNTKEDDKIIAKFESKKNLIIIPEIDNRKITEGNKLKTNMVYLKDYILLPERIFHLLTSWFPSKSKEIKRQVIGVDKTFLLDEGLAIKVDSNKYTNINSTYLEIEVNPIFICYLMFSNLLGLIDRSNNKENNLIQIKEFLYKKINEKFLVFNPNSRITKIKDLREEFEKQRNSTLRIWIYHSKGFYIPNEESNLENENVEEMVVIVFEEFKDGKWESEISIDADKLKEDEIDKNQEEDKKKVMIGLKNLGNSKLIFLFNLLK